MFARLGSVEPVPTGSCVLANLRAPVRRGFFCAPPRRHTSLWAGAFPATGDQRCCCVDRVYAIWAHEPRRGDAAQPKKNNAGGWVFPRVVLRPVRVTADDRSYHAHTTT